MTLSEFYFRPHAIELEGRVYRWCGVVWFKRRLMNLVTVRSVDRHENAYVLAGRRPEDLIRFERRSRRSEVVHLVGVLGSGGFLVFAVLFSNVGLAIAGVVLFLANFHCLILQRYNRHRIGRVLRRKQRLGIGAPRGQPSS